MLNQNTIQVIGFLIMNTCCLAYAIFQQAQLSVPAMQINSTLTDIMAHALPFLMAVIGVLAVAEIVFIFLAFKLYSEFGWIIYKKIGADPKMKSTFVVRGGG